MDEPTGPAGDVGDEQSVRALETGLTALLRRLLQLPDDTAMAPDRTSVRLDALDTGHVWTMVLGMVDGEDRAVLTGYEGPAQVTGALFGTTAQLDGWVRGTVHTDLLEVEGDRSVIDRLDRLLHTARSDPGAAGPA